MLESSGFGNRLGECLRAHATGFVSRSPHIANMAVTEVRADNPIPGPASLLPEDAFLVGTQLCDYPVYEYWEDGRPVAFTALRAGNTILCDLKRNPIFFINNPFHCVHFYFPRSALDAIAENAEAASIDQLRYQPGQGVDDPVMHALSRSLLSAFEHPQHASQLFIEHVLLAVGLHTATTYGGMRVRPRPARGGLAPWQAKRAKQILTSNLADDVSLADLARECGLSPSHFARAFRQSTGSSPHQWLLQHRVDAAKSALRDRKLSLSEVALACGFADQSHFTRVFTKYAGVSPGVWRRRMLN